MQGTFAKYGIKVQSAVAPSSDALRAALTSGKADIAHAAADNAVAMDQAARNDVIIVMGGEGSLNELIAQPDIHSIAQLRGRMLTVDAANTAFALQLKKILLSKGLRAGRDYQIKAIGTTPKRLQVMREDKQYAATMLGPPWSLLAKRDGFVSLGSTRKLIGPYQGLGAFVRRPWARDHADALERYLGAYVEAQRWLLAPANKQQVTALLMKQWHLSASVGAETYALLSSKNHEWYEPDAGFDVEGFKNVLKLRVEVEGQWGGRAPAVGRYYDSSYFRKALAMMNRPE
jgi:ABC-type nitrate/sulfonate/bicarbonate transport system substrate-binding protein